MGDGFTCDSTLIVENETLNEEVVELTHTLAKVYGGEELLLTCLGSQRFPLRKVLGMSLRKPKIPMSLTTLNLWRAMTSIATCASFYYVYRHDIYLDM